MSKSNFRSYLRTLLDVYGNSSTEKLNQNPLIPYLLALSALLRKRFQYFKRHWSILVAQLAIPFILMCFCLSMIRSDISKFATSYDPLKLDISSVYGSTDGFYYSDKPDTSALAETYEDILHSNGIRAENVSDPVKYALDYGKGDFAKYLKRLLVGGIIDHDSNRNLNLTAWFNAEQYHGAPISLLLMHTAILRKVTNSGVIDLTNAPFPERNRGASEEPASPRVVAVVFVPLIFAFLTASFTLLPIHERATKAKLLQLMCGVPSVLYWSAMFLWDYMIHCLVCILLIIPFAIFVCYAFFGMHSNAIDIHDLKSDLVTCEPDLVETNMFLIRFPSPEFTSKDFLKRMTEVKKGDKDQVIVKAALWFKNTVRCVLHSDLTQEDVECAAAKIKGIVS